MIYRTENEFVPSRQTTFAPIQTSFTPGKNSFVPGKNSFLPGQTAFTPGKDVFIPGQNAFTPISFVPHQNHPIADLSQYINPYVRNSRVENAIGSYVNAFRKLEKPDNYKTVMCQAFLETRACSFEDQCKFAHGEHELRPAKILIRNHLKYKTRPCMKYISGLCPFGVRCLFIHDPDAIPQTEPEISSFATFIGSAGSSPVNFVPSVSRPLPPAIDPIESIWAFDPKSWSTPKPRQQKFNKSGEPQRTPTSNIFGQTPMKGISIEENTRPSNKTAEELVSFLWM